MRKKGYAVITGASAGIGECFAKRLAKEGYPLVLVARRKERLEQLAMTLTKKYHITVKVIVCDVSKVEECYRLMGEIKDLNLSIFINNAGFGDCGAFERADLSKELNMIDVNVKAVQILTKLALKQMQKRKKGYILNVASSAGLIPAGPYMSTYYATKAYVASMTQAITEELRQAKSPIYVGCLCPGPVETEFNAVANAEFTLKGISASYCANYAIDKMFARKTVIIPTYYMKLAVIFGRFLPRKLYVRIVGMQQKRKLEKKL
ncbi:MAG: SDR family oxidoreductase [Lachnospiraceae bacterium]|nr:SDR family oxidoreductase [Lachnospiraceae bacterium]